VAVTTLLFERAVYTCEPEREVVMPRVAQEPVTMSSQGSREPEEKVGFVMALVQWGGVVFGRARVEAVRLKKRRGVMFDRKTILTGWSNIECLMVLLLKIQG